MKINIIPSLFFFLLVSAKTVGQVNGNSQLRSNHSIASVKPVTSHEYFIYLENVTKREDVLLLESLIGAKDGITFFMADRFPVRCFIMRSNAEISQEIFASWVGNHYPVLSYGTGSINKEKAYLIYKKNRKSNN